MKIIPAIDLLGKEAVRLYKGDYSQKTVYSQEPWELVKAFYRSGADLIHIVDLNAARDENDHTNGDCILKIRNSCDVKLQLGGGIRSVDRIKYYDSIGINRFILGTAAVRDPKIIDDALDLMGNERIIVSVDARDGYVRISGWEENTQIHFDKLLHRLECQGVKRIVFTDISQDGTMKGPSLESYKHILDHYDFHLIASGGISSIKDILSLYHLQGKKSQIYGAITGKAIYEGKLDLKEAITNTKREDAKG